MNKIFNFRIFGFFQQVVLKALIHSVGDLIPFISRKIIKNKYLGIFNLIMLYILMSTITTRINIIEFVLTTKSYLFEYYLDKLLVYHMFLKNLTTNIFGHIALYIVLYFYSFPLIHVCTQYERQWVIPLFLKNPTVDIFRPTAISFFLKS